MYFETMRMILGLFATFTFIDLLAWNNVIRKYYLKKKS